MYLFRTELTEKLDKCGPSVTISVLCLNIGIFILVIYHAGISQKILFNGNRKYSFFLTAIAHFSCKFFFSNLEKFPQATKLFNGPLWRFHCHIENKTERSWSATGDSLEMMSQVLSLKKKEFWRFRWPLQTSVRTWFVSKYKQSGDAYIASYWQLTFIKKQMEGRLWFWC